jgi:hypothetical protein
MKIFGQEVIDFGALQRQRAVRELEVIISDTAGLTDKSSYLKARARAANLLWLQDQERAKGMFLELWAWIEKQDEKSFSREDARAVFLGNLFPRDSKLARKLLETLQVDGKESSLSSKRLNKLASELLEFDPASAAELLTQSVIANPSPEALPILSRLRDKDAKLADGIAERLLDVLASQPTDVALPTVYALNYYVFPANNVAGEATVIPLKDSLRRHYFMSSYAALIQSLQEDKRPPRSGAAGNGKTSRSFFQVQLAELLAALSGRYASDRSTELQSLAAEVSAGASPEFSQVTQSMLRRVNSGAPVASLNYDSKNQTSSPESEIISALAVNDFNEAERLLDEVESASVKRDLSRMIATTEFRYHLAKGNIDEAFNRAQSTENSDTKVSMFTQIAAIALKRVNDPSSDQILAMSRAAIKKADCTSLKAKSMLSLASVSAPLSATDGVEWLRDGTICFNSLDAAGSKKEGINAKDNSAVPAGVQELGQAFSAVGKADLDNTLLVANMLDDSFVRLTAKLSACEKMLGVTDEKPSTVLVKKMPKAKSQ